MKSSNKKNVKIGKILEPKGLRGEVKVLFLSGDASWAEEIITLELHDPKSGKITVHNVEKLTATSQADRVCFKLSEINDRNSSERVKGFEVFASEDLFESSPGEEIFLREILGFTIYDQENVIGEVTGFDSNGLQDLLVVKNESGESVLLPFIKEFIVKIDFKNRTVKMNLPPGLLEINRAL